MPPQSSSTTSEPIRKELTQCQHCYKSRLALPKGVSLSKCAGCKIALYCSKECQKAAWSGHKTTCKINQRLLSLSPADTRNDEIKALRAFASKHRPSIAEYGISALDLCLDRTRSLRDIVVVLVKRRPESKKAETAYIVTAADVVPIEFFGGQQTEELRSQLTHYNDEHKRTGLWGCIMVMLFDSETMLSNICPVGFGPDIMELKPGRPWKEKLIQTLNNGIVF